MCSATLPPSWPTVAATPGGMAYTPGHSRRAESLRPCHTQRLLRYSDTSERLVRGLPIERRAVGSNPQPARVCSVYDHLDGRCECYRSAPPPPQGRARVPMRRKKS